MTDYALTLEVHPRNPRSRVRILSGTDDDAPFRCTVPMRIKTVPDALEWLRPNEVPADALRQGEFYFIPSDGPHIAAGCTHPDPKNLYRHECGSHEYTDAGSHYEYSVQWGASFSRTHRASTCRAVVKSGTTMFWNGKRTRGHDFTGRPRYFVCGSVYHAEHGTLELPCHDPKYQDDPAHRGEWYEVIPNKAHGPFPVWGFGPED